MDNRLSQAALGFVGAALLIASFSGSATAAPIEDIRKLDVSNNGTIDPGAELDALNAIRDQLSAEQLVTYEIETAKPDFNGIPVHLLDDGREGSFYNLLEKTCSIEKRFFLQESVSDFSLVRPGLFAATRNGASLSVAKNNLTDVSSWDLNGAAAWIAPGSKRCLTSDELRNAPGAVVTGYAFAPYVSFNGSGSSLNHGTSNLTFGVKSEIQVFAGLFDLQEISLNPYYGTDFDGQASIPGFHAVWRPYHVNARLNGYRIPDDGPLWWWNLSAEGDYKSVDEAGHSGLTQSTEYGWIGVNIGAEAKWNRDGSVPMYANVNFQAFRDLINDNSAELLTAAVGMNLQKDGRTSLELGYKRGRDYRSLTKFDGITLNLKLAF